MSSILSSVRNSAPVQFIGDQMDAAGQSIRSTGSKVKNKLESSPTTQKVVLCAGGVAAAAVAIYATQCAVEAGYFSLSGNGTNATGANATDTNVTNDNATKANVTNVTNPNATKANVTNVTNPNATKANVTNANATKGTQANVANANAINSSEDTSTYGLVEVICALAIGTFVTMLTLNRCCGIKLAHVSKLCCAGGSKTAALQK